MIRWKIKSVEHYFLLGPVGLQNHKKTTDFDRGAGDREKFEFLKIVDCTVFIKSYSVGLFQENLNPQDRFQILNFIFWYWN